VTPTADPQSPRPEADEVRQQLAGKHACPFCGVIRVDAQAPCPRCTMEDTPATRQATRQRIGPWFVLQARNPSAPGMKFATLVSLIKKNHVTPRSIVRGPTTQQLWSFAAQVRGLSREFGLCYACGEAIDRTANVCPHCQRHQEPPAHLDALIDAEAPEMVVSSQTTTNETGMDGGTSLDLQADAPLFVAPPAPAPKPRTPAPQPLARITPRPASPARDLAPAGKEESILTARELAAAFQLDFKTPGSRKARKPVGPVKMLVTLLLILAVGVAIVMTMRPEWRDQSLAWVSGRWQQVRHSLEQPAAPKTPPEHPTAPAVNPPAPAAPKPAPNSAEVSAPEARPATPRPESPRVESTRVESPRVEAPRVESPRVEAPPADSRSADAKPAPAPAPAEAPKPAAAPVSRRRPRRSWPPPSPSRSPPSPKPPHRRWKSRRISPSTRRSLSPATCAIAPWTPKPNAIGRRPFICTSRS